MRKVQNVTQLPKETKLEELTLTELIPRYAGDKEQEKIIKDIVKKENELLKDFLRDTAKKAEDGKTSKESGGWVVTMSIEDNSTMNEDKLISWLKLNNLHKGIVKKKEYVDSDALENAIYKGKITQEQVVEMDVCKEPSTKEVIRIKKAKKED